ncbi:MAG TPA: hypothetical protein VOA88_15815 [Candidatus Dormibacteraeota bacterium]|nr:hypothetical protein [Candidatus Dormibacteraeota bacterium]
MATSKSIECCTATATIYSGRPDPSWRLTKALVQQLENIWKRLGPSAGALPVAPALGYRGCSVNCGPRGIWISFAGVVSRGKENRADPGHQFERAVLNSAPKGVIPAAVLRTIEYREHLSD